MDFEAVLPFHSSVIEANPDLKRRQQIACDEFCTDAIDAGYHVVSIASAKRHDRAALTVEGMTPAELDAEMGPDWELWRVHGEVEPRSVT